MEKIRLNIVSKYRNRITSEKSKRTSVVIDKFVFELLALRLRNEREKTKTDRRLVENYLSMKVRINKNKNLSMTDICNRSAVEKIASKSLIAEYEQMTITL